MNLESCIPNLDAGRESTLPGLRSSSEAEATVSSCRATAPRGNESAPCTNHRPRDGPGTSRTTLPLRLRRRPEQKPAADCPAGDEAGVWPDVAAVKARTPSPSRPEGVTSQHAELASDRVLEAGDLASVGCSADLDVDAGVSGFALPIGNARCEIQADLPGLGVVAGCEEGCERAGQRRACSEGSLADRQ